MGLQADMSGGGEKVVRESRHDRGREPRQGRHRGSETWIGPGRFVEGGAAVSGM